MVRFSRTALNLVIFFALSFVAPLSFGEMWDGYCETNLVPSPLPQAKLLLPALSIDNLFDKSMRGDSLFDLGSAHDALDAGEREQIVRKLILEPNGFFGTFGLQLVTASPNRAFYIVDGKDKYALGNLVSDAHDELSKPKDQRKDLRSQFGKITYALFYSSLAYEYQAYSALKIKTEETLGLAAGSPEISFPNSLNRANFHEMQSFLQWLNEKPERATYAAHVLGECLAVFLSPKIYKSWLGPEDNYKHAYFNPKKFKEMVESQFVSGLGNLNPAALIRKSTLGSLRSVVISRLQMSTSHTAVAGTIQDIYLAQTPLLLIEQAPYAIGPSFAVDFMSVLDIKDFKNFKNKTLAAVEIAQNFSTSMREESERFLDEVRRPNQTPKRIYMLRTRLDSMLEDYADMEVALNNTVKVLEDTLKAATVDDVRLNADSEAFEAIANQLAAKVSKAKTIHFDIEKSKAYLAEANKLLN